MPPPNLGVLSCSLTTHSLSGGVYSYDTSFSMDSTEPGPVGSFQLSAEHGDAAISEPPINTVKAKNSTAGNERPSALYQYSPAMPKNRLQHHHSPVLPPQLSAQDMARLEKSGTTRSLNLPSTIFPDSSLPFAVNAALLPSLTGIWDPCSKTLIPPMDLTEPLVKDWLNTIARNLNSVTRDRPTRAWCLNCSESSEAMDVILLSDPIDPPSWANVKAVAEVTSHPELHPGMKKKIYYKACLIFAAQPSRRFVPFLAICSKKIHFIIIDREGQTSTEIDYLQKGEYHALNVLRVVAALVFANDETIGYDPTVTTLPDGSIQNVTAGDKTYKVHSAVHVVLDFAGRSTWVWRASEVEPDSELVVIKDGWPHVSRAKAEKEHLMALVGVKGIPKLIWGGTVQIRNPGDSSRQQFLDDDTAWIRRGFSDERAFRIHRRLVLKPFGERLSTFTSLGELVAALRDVAVAHKACCDRGILHRDISFNNILLIRSDMSPARQGMLIDFDYAAPASQKSKIGQRTGTPPFMAIALLLNGAAETLHYAKYDLESLMYVAFYCATMLKGPSDSWRMEADLEGSIPMQEWFEPHHLKSSFGQMGRTKIGHMALFENAIIKRMDKYFSPLFPCFRSLKAAVFPNNESYCDSPIDHDTMIDIFNNILKVSEGFADSATNRGTKRVHSGG